MKLTITRQQTERTDRKGRSEGVVFQLTCRLELDANESGIVQKYGRETYEVAQLDIREGAVADNYVSLARLREGRTWTTSLVGDLVEAEGLIKSGCARLRKVFEVLEGYGGQEELEF